MDDKARLEIANTLVECLSQLTEIKVKQRALEMALHTENESLYFRYMAECENLKKSKAHEMNAVSLSELREKLLR